MATRVGYSEIQMIQFDWPTPKTPCLMQRPWIYNKRPVIAHFVFKFPKISNHAIKRLTEAYKTII